MAQGTLPPQGQEVYPARKLRPPKPFLLVAGFQGYTLQGTSKPKPHRTVAETPLHLPLKPGPQVEPALPGHLP